MADFKIKSGEKIILIGDSITDCGRRDKFPPLGNGYVFMAANLATAKYPDRNIEWVNKGISGDIVQGLTERWTEDVVKEKPNWVSVAIGINNVERNQQSNRSLKENLNDFEFSYNEILSRTRRETKAELIMFEIFYLAEEDQNQRIFKVDFYNEIIHRLSAEYGALLVPVNSAFRRAKSKRRSRIWTTGDGVHPLPDGHALIALSFLEALNW